MRLRQCGVKQTADTRVGAFAAPRTKEDKQLIHIGRRMRRAGKVRFAAFIEATTAWGFANNPETAG
jgi:hypothetical protein